jgi:hypothetical protein
VSRRARPLALLLWLAACATAPFPRGAPANLPPATGFVAVTPQGVELEFDPAHQSYQVRGQPGTYWLDGSYFRASGQRWESSPHLDGPWQPCGTADLPAGLRTATLSR